MKSLLLCGLVVLVLPTAATALPFTPDDYLLEAINPRFASTGTNTVCLDCEDADPANDFKVVLDFDTPNSWPGGFDGWSGAIDFTGTTRTDFSGIALGIIVDLRLTMRETTIPDEIAAYPLPSVQLGVMSGGVFNADGPAFLVETCCSGFVGNVTIMEAFLGVPMTPPSGSHLILLEVHSGFEAPYTPEATAVPEPTTLLLLGSGLIGTEWKRCQRRHR